ncbi:testis-expressed sequence 11 protein [Arapaima gigas]
MNTLLATIKDATEKLFQKQNEANMEEIIEKLFSEASSVEASCLTELAAPQVEEYAIQLWNWAVTRHVGSAINEQQKAKVRHVACRLLYACEPQEPSESMLRKQVLMATKAGRTWLDCKNPVLANDFLNLAVKSLESLYNKMTYRSDGKMDINIPKGEVEKDLFRVMTYQAESAVVQGNHQEAVSQVQRCKEMLMRLPKETGYLCLLCYNFGVDSYNMKKYEESSFWLSQSYDIGKMNKKYSPGVSILAKVLRLLATVYMEWDCKEHQDKALNAITLANKESVKPSGLYLKTRILLSSGAQDEHVRAAVLELFETKVPLEVCLSTVKLLMSEDRETLAFELLRKTCQHFESSPELGTALVLHIQLLLQRGKELLGKQKVEDAITGHYAGKTLSPQTLCHLHLLLWDRASKHFEASNYTEALQWYNYSLSFFAVGQMDQNLAKLQRNRASCFLQLQQLEKAKEAIKEAERCDPDSIFTQFSIYKIAVLENNVDRATEAVKMMGKLTAGSMGPDDKIMAGPYAASNLLSLAAQMALEHKQQDTAVKALESLCEHSEDGAQVLTALRCLIRLVLSATEAAGEENRFQQCLLIVLQKFPTALQRLPVVITEPGVEQGKRAEEAGWFRKIAWNLALQCENSPDKMRDFFLLSYQARPVSLEAVHKCMYLQLSQFCLPDRALLMGQKTCLLMAVEQLTQALEYIQTCREVWKTLRATGDLSRDPTETLLLLYEFEARAKLNDPQLEVLLETVLGLDEVETKTLETIAALAMEPPAHYPLLCKKALRIALFLHKKQPQPDLTHCRQCIHSLVELSIPSGVSDVEPRMLEELWGYYEEALSIIEANVSCNIFPEMETLWLLTQAWNTGILLYSLAQYPEAERWCALGMSFLNHLHSLRESYQTKMSCLYGEVLDKLDKAKRNLVTEE